MNSQGEERQHIFIFKMHCRHDCLRRSTDESRCPCCRSKWLKSLLFVCVPRLTFVSVVFLFINNKKSIQIAHTGFLFLRSKQAYWLHTEGQTAALVKYWPLQRSEESIRQPLHRARRSCWAKG